MKIKFILLFLVPMSLAAQSINLEEWQEKWDNSRDYTIALLQSADSSMLNFKPTEDQMSLAEQMGHIAGNMYSLSSRFLDHKPENFNREAIFAKLKDLNSIATIEDELRKAYQFASDAVHALSEEQLSEEIEFFAGPKTRRVVVWLLQDHATHHRGQLIVYMRLLGIDELPRYRGW